MILRKLLLTLMLMGLAQAQELTLSPFSYPGVVQQVTPGGVWVQTSDGLNVMLPQGLDFQVGGTRVNVGSLVPGNPCQVLIPAGPAQLVALQGDVCTLMLPSGPCQVPVSCLPQETLEKSKVAVLKNNGKVVNVPLNAALNMQRSQGARILGASQGKKWKQGQALSGVVCGYQDDNLLVLDDLGVVVAVPRSLAGGNLVPGRPIYVPAGGSFNVQSWVPSYKVKGNSVYDLVPGNGNNGNGNNGKGNGKGNNGKGHGKNK